MSDSDRRQADRYNVTFRLACDDGQGYSSAVVVNLSATGALVQSEQSYALGSTLTLVPVGSAGEILFDIPGTIVRIVERPDQPGTRLFGLQFSELTGSRRSALRTLCAAMPGTPAELPLPSHPAGGPPQKGGTAHHRLRTRFRDTGLTPRWARRPF